MNGEDFRNFSSSVSDRRTHLRELIARLDTAPTDVASDDHHMDALAEAVFLRAFTSYEMDVERLFFHYVTGGQSLGGTPAPTYLRTEDEEVARNLVRGGWKFLSWARPDKIRETSKSYLANGWPIVDMMSTKTNELNDAERVRNRIAHRSLESISAFRIVQRNLYGTERLFDICPGQLLRTRFRRTRNLTITHYLEAMHDVLEAMIDPPR